MDFFPRLKKDVEWKNNGTKVHLVFYLSSLESSSEIFI